MWKCSSRQRLTFLHGQKDGAGAPGLLEELRQTCQELEKRGERGQRLE